MIPGFLACLEITIGTKDFSLMKRLTGHPTDPVGVG